MSQELLIQFAAVFQKAAQVEEQNNRLQQTIRSLEYSMAENPLIKKVQEQEETIRLLRRGMDDAKQERGNQKHRADCLQHAVEILKRENEKLQEENTSLKQIMYPNRV